MAYKTLHTSDYLIYQHVEVLTPFPTDSSLRTLRRSTMTLHASPGVTWQDIAAEVRKLLSEEQLDPILSTVTCEYPEFFVSLTLHGFVMILGQFPEDYKGLQDYENQIDSLAKELVAERDRALSKAL